MFEVVYTIGKNAVPGRGLFLFRLDYMSFEVDPPELDIHYHLRYNGVNIDHGKF